MDVVIGNSSSGITEVPSFKKATVNIGDRQQGRVKALSVIDCETNRVAIENGIQKALSVEFREQLKISKNPYGEKNSSTEIVEVLKSTDLNGIVKKQFYNLRQ